MSRKAAPKTTLSPAKSKRRGPAKGQGGKPPAEIPRDAGLPRIQTGKRKVLHLLRDSLSTQLNRKVVLAETIEISACMSTDIMMGIDPRRWLKP